MIVDVHAHAASEDFIRETAAKPSYGMPYEVRADGELVTDLTAGDEVIVSRSKRTVRLMHLEGTSFFETLRVKLHWRGANL